MNIPLHYIGHIDMIGNMEILQIQNIRKQTSNIHTILNKVSITNKLLVYKNIADSRN